jgi:hypothetical protein
VDGEHVKQHQLGSELAREQTRLLQGLIGSGRKIHRNQNGFRAQPLVLRALATGRNNDKQIWRKRSDRPSANRIL